MTETSDVTDNAVERFILQWGDMGGHWGVNRSVSQIHALLYLSSRPVTAEEIAERLGMARSNVSNSLKELLGWNLIRRVPQRADRRDHFEAETDVWEMFERIAAGRKEREIDPALVALRACVTDARAETGIDPVARDRLESLLAFTTEVEGFYQQMRGLPRSTLRRLLRMGARIVKLIPFVDKR